MAACDGVHRLQAEQCSLTARMSLVIPSQNTIDLARDSMDDTPWCAELRIRGTLSRRDGSATTRSRYKMTPVCYVGRVTICPECGDIIICARRSSGKPS